MMIVNDKKIVEVPPRDKGWQVGTLKQIISEFEEYKTREKLNV